MKYLKEYKNIDFTENKTQSELKSDIKDILLELQDDGFIIQITNQYIRIHKGADMFFYSEVEEYIDRLREYLGDRFINMFGTDGKVAWDLSSLFWYCKDKSLFRRLFNKNKQKIQLIKIEYNMPRGIEKFIDDYLKKF